MLIFKIDLYRLKYFFNRIFVLAAILATACFSGAQAQDCETALEDALESYDQKKYDETIARLKECPPERILEKAQKINAYELLALAYVAVGHQDSARLAINNLLALHQDYFPQAPSYTGDFIALVEKAKKERQQQEGRNSSIIRNKWFWLGGVAASSVAAMLIVNREEGPGLLPKPPDPPPIR